MKVATVSSSNQVRIASSLLMMTGLWLLIMPFVFNVGAINLVTLATVGTIVVLAGWSQFFTSWAWPSWATLYAGVSLMVLPFFWSSTESAFLLASMGLVVMVLSAWDEIEVSETSSR